VVAVQACWRQASLSAERKARALPHVLQPSTGFRTAFSLSVL
jgi:hypothetical protein